MLYKGFYFVQSLIAVVLSGFSDLETGVTYYSASGAYLLGYIVYAVFYLALFATYYTFRTIGLRKMAKNSGLVKTWQVVIPFFGIYACYKLSPNSKYIKKNTVICIFAIITGAMILVMNCLLDAFYGIPAIIKLIELSKNSSTLEITSQLLGMDDYLAQLMSAYLTIMETAYGIFMLLVFSRLFMSYKSQNVMKFVLLSALVYFLTDSFILAGIFVFAMRNDVRIDYDTIFEARAKWAQFTSQAGNPFAGTQGGQYYNQQRPNDFGSQNNGYGYNPDSAKEIDPFEEFNFSNTDRGNDEVSEDTDDFFN